jgi:hypothetical protein
LGVIVIVIVIGIGDSSLIAHRHRHRIFIYRVVCTVCEFHYTHMLKASGCLEVKEWELGDLKDTK